MLYHFKILIPAVVMFALSACKPGVYADFTPGKPMGKPTAQQAQAGQAVKGSAQAANKSAQAQQPAAPAEPFVPAGEKLNLIVPG